MTAGICQRLYALAYPSFVIAGDGSLSLHILRLESQTGIIFNREQGILVTTSGSPFVVDLLAAGLVHLAQVGWSPARP